MNYYTLTLAGGLLLCAQAVSAQTLTDTYGFVFGGTSLDGQLDTDGTIGGAPQTVDTDYDSGGQFGFGVGATIANRFRAELEISRFSADADGIAFSGNGDAAEVNVGGGVRTTAFFANALYDFTPIGTVTPYVGGGIGIARVEQDLVYGPGVRVPDDDTVGGVQLIGGLGIDLNDSLTLTTDIRYQRLFDVESNRLNPQGASTGVISGDLDNTTLNVGLRFAF